MNKNSELMIGRFIIGASLFFSLQAAEAGEFTSNECGNCAQLAEAIASLRTEMKENMAKQLKCQQIMQDMAWKTERLKSLTTMLEGINEEIQSKKERLDAEIEAKAQKKYQPPTEGSEIPSPAGLQENIDKFTSEIAEAEKRKTEIISEKIQCESDLTKLSDTLTQIEDEIRTR